MDRSLRSAQSFAVGSCACMFVRVCVSVRTGRAAVDRHQYECLIYGILSYTSKTICKLTCPNITHTIKGNFIQRWCIAKKPLIKCKYCKNPKSRKTWLYVMIIYMKFCTHLWHSSIVQMPASVIPFFSVFSARYYYSYVNRWGCFCGRNKWQIKLTFDVRTYKTQTIMFWIYYMLVCFSTHSFHS